MKCLFQRHRRKNHIELIDPNHALLPITIDCLHFQDKDRPSSEELCQRLAGLKESREYRESKQNHQDEIQAKDNQIIAQAQQLQEKDRLLQQRADEITPQNQQLQHENESLIHQLKQKDEALLDKDNLLQQQSRLYQEEITSRERQLRQLNQQLEEQEQVTAEIQQTNHSLLRQVEQLQQQLSQQSRQLPPYPLEIRKIILKWRDGGKVPLKMHRGAAIVDGNVAYFMNWSGDICSCYLSSNYRIRRNELPKCPYQYCSLAIIDGQLTAIGGMDIHRICTNKLFSLQTRQKEWKEVFPHMPTKQCSTTAVTSKDHLIVAGGVIGFSCVKITTTCKVEVMDTETRFWSTLASLPHPCDHASGTICGDQFYMLGGGDDNGKTKSVVTCSLTELLQSSSSSSSIWHRVADAPAYNSTCAAVNGELLAVGGCDEGDNPTTAIQKYNQKTNSWDPISNMQTARYRSLVAVLPTDEMMVVGGYTESLMRLEKVEIAKFLY